MDPALIFILTVQLLSVVYLFRLRNQVEMLTHVNANMAALLHHIYIEDEEAQNGQEEAQKGHVL